MIFMKIQNMPTNPTGPMLTKLAETTAEIFQVLCISWEQRGKESAEVRSDHCGISVVSYDACWQKDTIFLQ